MYELQQIHTHLLHAGFEFQSLPNRHFDLEYVHPDGRTVKLTGQAIRDVMGSNTTIRYNLSAGGTAWAKHAVKNPGEREKCLLACLELREPNVGIRYRPVRDEHPDGPLTEEELGASNVAQRHLAPREFEEMDGALVGPIARKQNKAFHERKRAGKLLRRAVHTYFTKFRPGK